MTPQDALEALVSQRLGRILDAAELCLDQRTFETFRRIALNEFGEKGLRRDIRNLIDSSPGKTDWNGLGRNDYAGKEVRHD